jgi:hypothetical protein
MAALILAERFWTSTHTRLRLCSSSSRSAILLTNNFRMIQSASVEEELLVDSSLERGNQNVEVDRRYRCDCICKLLLGLRRFDAGRCQLSIRSDTARMASLAMRDTLPQLRKSGRPTSRDLYRLGRQRILVYRQPRGALACAIQAPAAGPVCPCVEKKDSISRQSSGRPSCTLVEPGYGNAYIHIRVPTSSPVPKIWNLVFEKGFWLPLALLGFIR